MYRALAEVTAAMKIVRTIGEVRDLLRPLRPDATDRPGADDGGVPRRTRRAVPGGARRMRPRRRQPVREPEPVRRSRRPRRLSARRGERRANRRSSRGSTCCLPRPSPRCSRAATRRGSTIDGAAARSRRRPSARPFQRRRHRLRQALLDRRPDGSRSSDRRTRSRWPSSGRWSAT